MPSSRLVQHTHAVIDTTEGLREAEYKAFEQRLQPFADKPASMELGAALMDAELFPPGSELNDVFGEDDWGPLTAFGDFTMYPVEAPDDAVAALVEVLTVGQAYGMGMASERVADAEQVARDLVRYLGPTAEWSISWRELPRDGRGGRARIIATLREDMTFGAVVVGRGPRSVFLLIALDDD